MPTMVFSKGESTRKTEGQFSKKIQSRRSKNGHSNNVSKTSRYLWQLYQ